MGIILDMHLKCLFNKDIEKMDKEKIRVIWKRREEADLHLALTTSSGTLGILTSNPVMASRDSKHQGTWEWERRREKRNDAHGRTHTHTHSHTPPHTLTHTQTNFTQIERD